MGVVGVEGVKGDVGVFGRCLTEKKEKTNGNKQKLMKNLLARSINYYFKIYNFIWGFIKHAHYKDVKNT